MYWMARVMASGGLQSNIARVPGATSLGARRMRP